MTDFNIYLQHFFAIGSKSRVRENRKALLENMVSCVPHTLTTPQKIQARKNLGLDTMYKVGQKMTLTKGQHTITFTEPMADNYVVFATASNGAAAVNVVIVDDSNLNSFTVKVAADCTLRWIAYLITEL